MSGTFYGPKVFRDKGGNRLSVDRGGDFVVLNGGTVTVESGGTVTVESGGTVTVESGGTLMVAGTPALVDIVVGTQVSTTINVTIQLNDASGAALTNRASLFAYLSDDAAGDSVATTAPDTVAIGTDGLAMPLITGKAWQLTSEADGDIDITITENGADTWYLIIVLPSGQLVASGAITFAI